MNKKYEISVKANKKSVEQLKADLTSSLNGAFENLDTTGKVKLSRSDKAAIKADLSSLFGIADEQADALRKMVQGIIPSDTKSIDHMKSQLQDTLKFATGIMEQMKLLGDSTDWMKQGVSFVDKFVAMQGTLLETQNVVSGIQTSVDKLTESFKTFKDALALTNNDAYLKRFSSEAKLAVDDVVKAQEILNKASKSRSQKIKTLSIANDVDVTDYTDMSAEDIREEYTSIIQAIKDGNAEIERLEAEFKGKKTKLYDSEEYQRELRGLATEVQNLQNLSKHPLFKDAFAETGTQINANLKAVTTEITNAAEKAGRELKEVIESLKGEGIEISVTLPDPDAAEFGSKISEFVNKASAQFKKKPIEISLDLSNPFKDAKKIKEETAQGRKIKGLKEVFERNATEAGVAIGDSLNGLDTTDTSRIVQNVVESFNKVYNAVKTGQATITEATNQWRKDMLKALTLKAAFDNTEAKAEVSAMMQELQNYLDENKPLYINTDTDELVQSIQQALNEAKFTVDVKAGNIDGSGVVSNVQIGQILNGLSNIQLATTDNDVAQTQQGKTPTPSRTAIATTKNADAVQESTREQRILTDTIKSLQFSIDRNHSLDKMMESGKTTISPDTVKELEHKIATITSRGLEITSRKNEITRLLSESTDASFVSQLRSEFKELENEWARLYEQSQRLESQKRNIEIKLEQLADGESVDDATTNADKRQKENNLNTKRISAIQSVLDNNESPATLVLNEVNKFWTQSSRIIERTEKEIAESTEALNKLKPDSEEYSNLYREIQKNQNKVDTWKNRQALMSQKGLVDMSGMGLEEAIQTLTDVLRKSPTLSDELLHSDGLKSLSSSKNIAYYANVAQEALGFRTQTEQEYVDEKTLQAKFVELFRINEFLKKVNSMFPKGGAEPNVEAVEGFINFFEKVPEMSSAVESAKKYLDELKNVAELQANDEMFKTFKESGLEDQYFPQRAQELWGQMDDSIRTTLSQELSSRGIDAKNFANLEDASDAFEQMKLLYKEGVFDSVKSENADFQQLITLLKQSTAVDSTRKSLQTSLQGITTSFEGRLRSVLFEAINTGEPISVKVVDDRGNERVYDIHDQGRGKLDSDRSFSTNTKSLNQFLRISGLEKQMSDIVYAMFNDQDLAKTLIDNLFADGKVQLASKKNAFLPKSSQKYTFDETPLGQYIKNEEKNVKEREKLEAELVDLKAGKYSESLSKRLEALPVDKQTEAINSIIALKERQLASIQKLDLTEDQIAQSLVALADDIEIAEAKMQKSQQGSRQSDKKAQRLLKDGTNSWTYQTAQKKAKNATFDKDYNLKQLFERIDIADTFGLMNTSVLLELADEYEIKQKEARELTDLNKAGLAGKDKVDAAWDELRKSRNALIEEYYKTEGWYLTNLAQSRMETAENEIRRMNKDTPEDDIVQFLHIQDEEIIKGLKGKSDVQLMAERYNTSSANNKADAQNEAAILAEKKKQLKSLMEKYGVTTEMLEAERNLTRVSSESVDATKNTVDNITQESSRSSGSNGVMSPSGLVGVLNSSNLATESTLRGLYEILNGGAPKGGWDNESTFASGVKDELDLSVHSFSSNLTGLAGGIKRFVDSVRNASLENMAFFNDVERVGNAIKGTENGVEGSKIKSFLNRHKSDGVKLALHNHPDGISALSPADIQSAIALVSQYGVGMAGSVAGNKVTGVDFSGISKEIGLKILDTYKNNIKKSKFSEIFDDNFEIKEEFANSANLDRQKLSNELNKLLQNAISSVGLNPDDIFGQIDVSKLNTATKKIAETIIENGTKAAIENVETTVPNLQSFDAATTKELAQYISGNFKKDNGKNVSGSRPLSAAMYDLSRLDIFAEGFTPTDVNSEQLAKAWNQLQVGMTQEVAKQLNDDIKAYIQLLQFKLQEIANANGLDYNAINSAVNARKVAAQDISGTKLTKESVEATKQYLGTFTKTNKKGKTVKETGISRAQSGLKNVYSVLSNGRDTLTNANLKDLGTGYYQLVETINHEIFSKLNEETQQLLIQARDAALATLDKYGVKVYGSGDLQNQVISDDTKNLIKGGKVGHKFDSMTTPALVKTVTDADGNAQDKLLQKAQGRVVAEKAVTEEKKKQKKLAQEGTQQEAKVTQEVQERAQAEQKATKSKKNSKDIQPKTSSDRGSILPSDTIKVPESGNNQGGILGLLGKIAQESTLQSVLAQLSKGVKTSSGGEGGTKPGKKTDIVLSDSEALSKLQEKIKVDYPEFASVSNSRAVSGGHAIDVFQYKNLDKIKEARADIARLNAEGKAGTEEWNEAQRRLNSLLTEQEKITLKINTATGEITTKSSFQNLAVGAKAASKELQNIDSIMSQLHDAGALSLGSDGSVTSSNQTVQNYLNSLRQLEIYKDSLSQDMLFDPSTQQQLSNLTLDTQNYRKEVMSLLKATSQLNNGEKIGDLVGGIDGLDDNTIMKSMKDIIEQSNNLEKTFSKLTPVTNEFGEVVGYQLAYSVRTGKHEVQEMTASLNPLTNELKVQKGAVKEVATGWEQFFSGLKGKASSIMQYLISITSIHDVFRYFSQGVQYVREIDSALTELKKVTDETDASYTKFLQDMSKTGSVIGATVSNLTTMAAEWARLGYSMDEAGKLAESTAILLNVSEFEDATTASEALISTMQAFQYTANESQHVVDILNEVGNNYAISSDGIATALQDSASALMAAGNNLEQSVALVASANRVVQDPNSVGSALRTISLRLRGTSVSVLEEMGEETDGVVESVSKMQSKIEALTGVNILTDSGAYKDTYTILYEIGNVWEKMSDMDQAALLELMAGKNRANTLAAILGNMEDLEGAYKDALNAEGSALKENAAYLDSIQGRIDLFNNAMQTMWMNFINADVVKFIVDIGTGLIKLIDTVGVLSVALTGLFAGMFAKYEMKKNNVDFLSLIFETIPTNIKNAPVIQNFASTVKTAFAEAMSDVPIKANSLDILAELANFDDANNVLGDLANIFGDKSVTKDGAKQILDSFDDISDATKEAILNSNLFTASQTGAAVGTNVFTASLAKAKAGLLAFGAGLKAFALAHPIIAGLTAAVIAFGAAWAFIDAVTMDHEEYIEKLQEETEELKNVQSKLKSVNEELETTKKRIDELQAKDTLSFVEEEELNRLKEQTKELERQEAILLAQEKRARNKQIETALNAAKTDPNESVSIDAKSSMANGMYYAASQQHDLYIYNNPYAAGFQNNGVVSDENKYEVNLNGLKKAKEDLEKAEIELANTTYDAESKEYKKLEKAVEEAQGRVDKYNNAIDSMDEAWKTQYGEVGYIENATTDAEKKWNEFYRQHQDYLDQQALINDTYGKSTILDRVFGEKGTDIAKGFKEQFESSIKEGKDPVKVIEELLASENFSSTLNDLNNKFGITANDIVGYFTQIGEVIAAQNSIISVQTYSELSASIESYNEILTQTSEIVSDNTEVTQEYKDSLTALGISNEELSECFDKNNGLIVKNADKLKDLIKKQKDEYKNNVKTAKSQAKLKYYKLAKDLVNTVKSTKNLTNAQRDHIKTILKEMDAVQDTISKYTMLESELLGVTNAYKKLADAQEIDSATDYGSKAEEMVNALANAFNTGELGTAAAEAAFEGLIPDWVVANAQSVDEAMESAYNYMRSGNLSGLFDIKYDDNGKLESVQMTLDKVKSFTGALIEADEVFHGTWDKFTLDPAIQNLDDFANAVGVTKEVAFAYLTELERYDAGNIFGDSSTGLLDQLMGDNFDYVIQQASQKYAQAAADMLEEFDKVNEKVDMFNRKILYDNEGRMVTMASQTFKASDFGLDGDFAFNVTPILPDGTKLENVEDYIYDHLASGGKLEDMDIFLGSYDTLDEAIAKGERLSELQGIYYENQLAIEELENKALDFASAWGKTSDQLTDAREEAESLGRELAGAKNGVNESTGRTVEEIEADIKKNDQLISDLLSNLDKLKDEFGGEPTEMVVGVALDELQEDIDNFKKDLEKKPAELKAAITEIDSTGFENLGLTKEADGSWSGLAELDWYQKLDPVSQEEVTNYLNMIESEHYLNLLMGDGVPTIEDHLQTISTVLQDIARMMNPTYTLHADTANATNNVITFKNWWNSLGDKVVTLYQRTIGSWFGGGSVNGTANVGGSAYAGGKWGAKQRETSLVGELGPEMVVRGNRWFTVGENGAEFTQVKKGDIIFNHKQTEQLLENGHVTGRGKAYASGTAYASIDPFTPYVPPSGGSGGNNDDDDDDDDDSDDIADNAEEVVDFIEMKLEEIEAFIEKTTTRIDNFLDDTTDIKGKDELYDELVRAEKDKAEAYWKAAQKYNVEAAAALSGVPKQYQEMARNGAIAIEDFIGEDQVEIAEKIQEYRDWAAKADEAENGHLAAIAAISAHRVEQLEDIASDFENIISISQSHSDLLQAEMDFIEESGGRLSESYYEELKKHSQKQLDDMQAERAALQKILDDSVAAGDVIVGSDDWYSMLETIYEVDQEIIECKTSLEEFQNAINELHWDNFDKLITEIDNVNSELSNLYDLISDDDQIADEMGNWTNEGITALGLLAQQMENAQFKAQEYGDAIEKLKKDYANGLYSTDEYNEKLADLTESQYDAIKSYEDAKDAIVDLNKARVEAVKEGMQKEIDAYSELIEKKKESLNSDKEAYDFQKQVQESTKNIEDIERKIAALQGNTSSSAMAQRKRLEAELLKAREELNDLYYDHSVEKQQEALDKELEGYTQNKEDQMDALDEYLEKEEQVIADSFDLIAENTKTITDTLISISEEYGVTISDTIVAPWIEGTNAIGTYQEQLDASVSATTANLETLKQHLEDLQTQADKTAESVMAATRSTIVETNDGHQTSIKGYAKGSKSVEYDQWALIDELGDELQLIPNEHGRLDYIKKGTGILNNTLTERLIDLAVDPTSMLENSRPVIGAPGITTTNNTFAIDASVGTLLHVEHLDGSNPAEVAKLVDKAWEKKMQTLNNSIKKFTR